VGCLGFHQVICQGIDQQKWFKDSSKIIKQWIGLRENLQKTKDFHMKYEVFHRFPVIFPLDQSIESSPPCLAMCHWQFLKSEAPKSGHVHENSTRNDGYEWIRMDMMDAC
jgi:hypothetical protein